jgi:hypothetical protein
LGRKEVTGREGIDGRSPFTNPKYATIRFSRMRQISPMRICNFEKFRGGNTYPDPLKRRKNREERDIGQGNRRIERKIEGLGRKEVTGQELGIDGRSPFHKS